MKRVSFDEPVVREQFIITKDKIQEYEDSNDSEYEKLKKTNMPLMTAVAISNILYTNLHSFYPIYMSIKYKELTSFHFGIILAIFEIANLITSLVLGAFMSKVKRRNLIIQSYFILLVSTLSFCFLDLLSPQSSNLFFILSISLRIF